MTTTHTPDQRVTSNDLTREPAIEAPRNEQADRTLNDSLRRMMDSVGPESIFGPVFERDGAILIPCAEVTMGFGMGGGSGVSPTSPSVPNQAPAQVSGATPNTQPSATIGSGMGGGGGARGRVVAIVTLARGKARVTPVLDMTQLGLAAMTAVGFVAFMVSQIVTSRSRAQMIEGRSAAQFARMMRAPFRPSRPFRQRQ